MLRASYKVNTAMLCALLCGLLGLKRNSDINMFEFLLQTAVKLGNQNQKRETRNSPPPRCLRDILRPISFSLAAKPSGTELAN
jgi:hypothetical protein